MFQTTKNDKTFDTSIADVAREGLLKQYLRKRSFLEMLPHLESIHGPLNPGQGHGRLYVGHVVTGQSEAVCEEMVAYRDAPASN